MNRNTGRGFFVVLGIFAGTFLTGTAELHSQDGLLQEPADVEGTYGYVRFLEGSADIIQVGTSERVKVSVNEPVLVGDQVFLAGGARAEIVLADGNILRIDQRSDISFRTLANSSDAEHSVSTVELLRGTIQVIATPDASDWELPRVETPQVSVEPRRTGSFLVTVSDAMDTEVTIRVGSADVVSRDEIVEVRAGQTLRVSGLAGSFAFRDSPGATEIERWGQRLSAANTGAYAQHVDPTIHYAANTLDGHGTWVRSGGVAAWRPRVSTGWAPYRLGRWRHTPTGLFWISHEPWGWVPYHYGRWDLDPFYGWVWFPGTRFAAAHVYWYWGPSYFGWVPAGYYRRHHGFRGRWGFGVHGYIDGSYGGFRHWTFLPHGRIGHRRQFAYSVPGGDLRRRGRAVERGILFTDSRYVKRDRSPVGVASDLRRAVPRGDNRTGNARTGNASSRSAIQPKIHTSPQINRVGVRRPEARVGPPPGSGATRTVPQASGDRRAVSRTRQATTTPLKSTSVPSTRPRERFTGSRTARPAGTTRSTPTVSARPQARTSTRTAVRAGTSRSTPRPTARPAARPTPRSAARPTARSTARPTSRTPARPTARPAARPTPRSAARPTTRSTARPTSRTPARPTARPAARPTPRSTARPATRSTARHTSRAAVRPAVRSSTRAAPRSAVRPTTPSRAPTVRSRATSPSRTPVRPTNRATAKPTPRSSARPASRTTVRSSSPVRRTGTPRSGAARRRGGEAPAR